MAVLNGLFNSRQGLIEAGIKEGMLFPVSEEQKKRIQDTVLEMYKDILFYCEKHDMVPFLVGGSALGAYRHHGFIPWDDDLDVGMMREQYDRFVKGFRKQFRDKYVVITAGIDRNAKSRFTKIMKKGTICKELFSPPDDSINGIFVDVFPIDNVPDNKVRRFIKGYRSNLIEFIAGQVYYKEFANEQEKQMLRKIGGANYLVRRTVGAVFGFRNTGEWNAHLDRVERWEDDHSKQCSIVPGRKHYFGEIIDRDIINPPRYIDFEGIKAPVFHDVEVYLRNLYGDNYMTVPPVEKREKHLLKELDFGED